MSSITAELRRANRLAREKSPYLLQHQFNPVDWYPWGDEAFARARGENKPIFLSIGYSTCHWCHVMERESFEDPSVAEFLNERFVSVKLDREERPDLDKIYMSFVQATTGQGGWPLSLFLTPDRKPFYGGTYFPPESRYGRPSFLDALRQIAQLWESKRDDLLESAGEFHRRLAECASAGPVLAAVLTPGLLERAAQLFKSEYDPAHGGFGSAPKFPRPAVPSFLLRRAARAPDETAARMVLHTCEAMANGGIYDQLGGGFSRYSVDAQWSVPHFEKMLYDNAQLASLYLEAFQFSRQTRFAEVARRILEYARRDMTHPSGGFYSAEDADSEGKEGRFYTWTLAELNEFLTPEEFQTARRHFGLSESGNFIDHSDPHPLLNQNVLRAADSNLSAAEVERLASAKRKMFARRSQRVRPHLDDKILASWNGLMLGAFAQAGAILGDEGFIAAAERNLKFLQDRLWDAPAGALYHRWRDGERDSTLLLDAYADLLAGTIDLYQATLDPRHLEFAVALARAMVERFYDAERGGFWQSPPQTADLLLRLKEDYDGAEPSGNSVATLALLKLAAITGDESWRRPAEQTLRFFGQRLEQVPQAVPLMLVALDFWLHPPLRICVAGQPASPETRALLAAAHRVLHPSKIVMGAAGPVEAFVQSLPLVNGRPAAYLCSGASCLPPVTSPDDLEKAIPRNS